MTNDRLKRERNFRRSEICSGLFVPLADRTLPEVCRTNGDIRRLQADAERVPEEYFTCWLCGSGPWHVTWGAACPNCSGA